MKNILIILSLIFSCALLSLLDDTNAGMEERAVVKESTMQEKGSADAQRNFEVISNDLKSSNCLTPRRVSQNSNSNIELRTWKTLERALQNLLLRNTNQYHKLTQHISTNQTINISTLFCRMAEHVFTMRKLII